MPVSPQWIELQLLTGFSCTFLAAGSVRCPLPPSPPERARRRHRANRLPQARDLPLALEQALALALARGSPAIRYHVGRSCWSSWRPSRTPSLAKGQRSRQSSPPWAQLSDKDACRFAYLPLRTSGQGDIVTLWLGDFSPGNPTHFLPTTHGPQCPLRWSISLDICVK